MIATALTEMFGLRHPIVLAPMGGVSGGRLAAAVSNAGGLGLVGGGYGDAAWLRTELALAKKETPEAWGVGFITWSVTRSLVELAVGYRPHAVMLSFGDPRPLIDPIRRAGCMLICQVQDLDGARRARQAGADVIVAQGTEAGGHGGARATLPLVPAVVDAVHPIPVVAAGGIADGRGLAAALMLGAQGALIGTRFYASSESLGHASAKKRIVAGGGDQTARTRAFDEVRGLAWPQSYTGRALRNPFMARWDARGDAREGGRGGTAASEAERESYREAVKQGDFDTAALFAGEALDLIDRVEDAAALVARISAEAEVRLRTAARLASEAPRANQGQTTIP